MIKKRRQKKKKRKTRGKKEAEDVELVYCFLVIPFWRWENSCIYSFFFFLFVGFLSFFACLLIYPTLCIHLFLLDTTNIYLFYYIGYSLRWLFFLLYHFMYRADFFILTTKKIRFMNTEIKIDLVCALLTNVKIGIILTIW